MFKNFVSAIALLVATSIARVITVDETKKIVMDLSKGQKIAYLDEGLATMITYDQDSLNVVSVNIE